MIKTITKNIFLVLFASVLGFQAQAQGMKERAANDHFDKLAFFKAAEMYSELAKKSKATDHQIRRAAESFRFMGNSVESENWYRKLSTHEGVKAEDFYHFAQMLKMNKKYDEANKMMAKFGGMKSSNSIPKAHAENADYVTELMSMPNKYDIAIFGVNTKASDFGPNYYTKDGETNVVFASARTANTSAMKKRFQWDGSNFLDAYQAQTGGDGENVKVKRFDRGIKSKYHEGPVSFSNNGDIMYLTRSNYLNKKKGLDSARHNNLKLYIATRSEDGEWGGLTEFPYNSDYYSVGHATLTEDGKTMYFTSDMPGGKGETDIWMSKKEGGKWAKPVNVESVNTEGREMFPFIGKNNNLYFSSDGYAGLGGLDVYRATASSEGSFDKPENMMYPLNTNMDDFGLIMNQDETEGYFSSNRKGEDAVGDDDIYRFQMLIPFKPKFYTIKGCVKKQTQEVIPTTTVRLVNVETNEVFTQMLSASGCYEFVDVPGGEYRVEGEKPTFEKISFFDLKTDDAPGSDIKDADVYLKEPACKLVGQVVDAKTKSPLSGVSVNIKDKMTGQVKTFVTDNEGKFMDPLAGLPCPGAILDYEITMAKDGFLVETVNYKKVVSVPGVINMNGSLDLELIPGDAGTSIGRYCKIEDILYDFDKSFIRPDAAVELDKLVACMKANPTIIVEIGSHTDCRATKRYNERLSDRRAKAARKYVISRGIAANRIFGKGYGETVHIEPCPCEPTNASNCSEDQHQLNRRTEFKIVGGTGNVQNNSTNSFGK